MLIFVNALPIIATSSLDTLLQNTIQSANFLTTINLANGPRASNVYHDQQLPSPTGSVAFGASMGASLSPAEYQPIPSATKNLNDEQSLLESFDFGLFKQLIELLPKVSQVIEDTIFEEEPTQQVNDL